ncbi:sigma factor-like helix-turn-helix DNA-binding protein [Micrococcus sp. IITD107]|uniref:sigma factor-like helix-turn-helix DNA-binding protein n=1 Tax=Micrococcus sp. IITD107 TaxID=3342790 RepID=UPI0035BAB233
MASNTAPRRFMRAPRQPMPDRDIRIVERYAGGETLESIGNSYGITRERVRQIVKKVGGTSADESRKRRVDQREIAYRQRLDRFMDLYGPVAGRMASLGMSREEAVGRLKMLHPDLEVEFAHDALRTSSLVFDRSVEDIFSTGAMEAAIWYLIGAERGLAPDLKYASVHLDFKVMHELSETLLAGDATEENVATVLGIIGAAKKLGESDPGLTITGARYNELRLELLETLGWVSARGSTPWPPTRQTFSLRFGSWNAALASMGLSISDRGRSRGLLKFTEDDYLNAIHMFLERQEAAGRPATFDAYDQLAGELAETAARIPSGSSVRNYFGGWTAALRQGSERAEMRHDAPDDINPTIVEQIAGPHHRKTPTGVVTH